METYSQLSVAAQMWSKNSSQTPPANQKWSRVCNAPTSNIHQRTTVSPCSSQSSIYWLRPALTFPTSFFISLTSYPLSLLHWSSVPVSFREPPRSCNGSSGNGDKASKETQVRSLSSRPLEFETSRQIIQDAAYAHRMQISFS